MKPLRHLNYQMAAKTEQTRGRIYVMIFFTFTIFALIIFRLFHLQVIRHTQYAQAAEDQHFGAIELPAKRGEIYVKDTHSGELSKLATNTTLDVLFVDPMIAEDKSIIADKLPPVIFTKEDYKKCQELPEDCFYDIIKKDPEEKKAEEPAEIKTIWDIETAGTKTIKAESDAELEFKTYPNMLEEISTQILSSISKPEVDFAVLKRSVDEEIMADIINERLSGIFVNKENFLVYGDPTLIPKNEFNRTISVLSEILDIPATTLESQLIRRPVKYVKLQNKLSPEASRKIKEMKLKGVGLIPEHWRFYPEGDVASHLVGFISREGVGQYGIEGQYNIELEGKKGSILAESDPNGRQITVGDAKIVSAIDGQTIVLTIDRFVQKEVERILKKSVEDYRADSGQVIIMNPFSGAILAMANYPNFDPNAFGKSYELRKLDKGEKVNKTVEVFKKNEKNEYVPIDEQDLEDDKVEKYIFKNLLGPGVFKNKTVSEYYEPGSIFKPIVMAVGIDAGEVSPETTFNDDGPIKIDNFTIKNSDLDYHGITTMVEVLQKSLNTGMSRVAQKLGKKLMYTYLKEFGFGEYTNINLEGEVKGDFKPFESTAQMLTTSFGQGIVVTPLQMINAWAALANGGKLMQPYIVDSTIKEGVTTKTEPEIIHRVISEESSSIITSMLTTVVKGKLYDVPGHLIAGKTGTAQIAGKGGRYETGEGSTTHSVAGYFPALKPQFVILVKLDRPRTGPWAENTSGPTFKNIAEFLIDYYNIQPDY